MRKALLFTGLILVSLLSFSQCLKNNCQSGYGIYKGENFIYKGDFENSKFHGKGELELKNQKYIGDFLNGKKNGFGEFYIDNKIYFKGEFKNNQFHGRGTLFFEQLEFSTGEISAKGNIEWTGQFNNGEQEGGSYNFQNPYEKQNIISEYEQVQIDCTREGSHFYIPICFVNDYEKEYYFDPGCTSVFLSLEDFNELRKKGLEYKKTNILTYAKDAENEIVESRVYEIYNIMIKDILVKKINIEVSTKENAATLIGMEFFDMFYDYTMPNKRGKMTFYFDK